MKPYLQIVTAILILLLFSCRKEPGDVVHDPVIPDPDSLIIEEDFFLFPDSALWIETRRYTVGVSHPYYDNWTYNIDTSWFYFSGDTTLIRPTMLGYDNFLPEQPHLYKKLHWVRKNYRWNLKDESPEQTPGTLTVRTGYAAFLRQDAATRRVYIATNSSYFHNYFTGQREYILYDFSLKAGDTLPFNAWNGFLANIYTVDSVITTVINGKSLKTFKIFENHISPKGTIIEGIGGLDSFLRNDGTLVYFRGKGFEYHMPEPE
ncbi:MAG: hypothetical protein K0B15_11095 [Lentimicrobium sp.]|nr:hypothetical protein [Lentimicrobium sp.]